MIRRMNKIWFSWRGASVLIGASNSAEQGGKTKNRNNAGAEIDGEPKAAGRRHSPQGDGRRPHRQVG